MLPELKFPQAIATPAVITCSAMILLPTLLKKLHHPQKDDGNLRIAVVGAGAIGTLVGLRLVPEVQKVTLVGRTSLRQALERTNHVFKIQDNTQRGSITEYKVGDNGVDVVYEKEQWKVLADHDIILVAVKTVDTHQVGTALASILPQDATTTIVSLQNGADSADILRDCLVANHPQLTILDSVVGVAAEWVPHTSTFCLNVNGGLYVEESAQKNAKLLIAALRAARIPTRTRKDLQPVVLAKLLMNATINPVNALAGVTIPVFFADSGYRHIMAVLLREGAKVTVGPSIGIWAVGMLLDYLPGWSLLAKLMPRTYKSSMLQDIERKRPKTEIDALNGEIVRRGEAPVHSRLIALVKELEKSYVHVKDSEELMIKLGLKE